MGVQERKARLFQEREQEILAAALELFRRDDWQAVTIEEIAAEVGIGKGTIYKHFASKLEIYATLAIEFQRLVLQKLRRIDGRKEVLDYLRAALRVIWDAHMSSREYHRLFQFCHQEDIRHKVGPAIRERMDELDGAMMACLDVALQKGIGEGLFPPIPLPLMLFGPRSALWGAIDIAWSGCADIDREEFFEQITRFILAGLMHQDDRRVRGEA